MIKHRLFSKGDRISFLMNSLREPHILIPATGIIYDVNFDKEIPRYQVKLEKFYDKIMFLKRHVFHTPFKKEFNSNTKRSYFNIRGAKLNTLDALNNYIKANPDGNMVVIDSVMCKKTYSELSKMFCKIQDFLVEKEIRELNELTSRPCYNKGTYFYATKVEFIKYLRKFLDKKAPDDLEWYKHKLLGLPNSEALRRID